MKKIRSQETKSEIILRKTLWANGVRYRKNFKKLPGSPDIVVTRLKLAIFVDGEFWHGYNWSIKKEKIKANRLFWIPKIERNIERDNENNGSLSSMGYTVLRFWEHEIKKNLQGCLTKILAAIEINRQNNPTNE